MYENIRVPPNHPPIPGGSKRDVVRVNVKYLTKKCYIKSQYSFCTVIILHETGNSRDSANFCLRAIVCKNDRCLLDDVIGIAPITQVTHVRNKNSSIQGRSLKVIKAIFHTLGANSFL